MAHGAMIIAVAGPCSCDSSAIVAALAAARARSGRQVLVIAAGRSDGDCMDQSVPARAISARCLQRDQLVARLNSARMFNPGLHVLFAVVCGDAEPSAA